MLADGSADAHAHTRADGRWRALHLCRYARYLRVWLGVVAKRQIMLINFDEWTENASSTMQARRAHAPARS